MKWKRAIQIGGVVVAIVALAIAVTGCDTSLFTQYEQWDHVMSASEFTEHSSGNYLVYTYEDARFNNVDLFDMQMINADGVSDFDSVYDDTLFIFYYQPMYDTGTVTWFAHLGADASLDGQTLRFYHIWK